jgi:hypothetical protein
MFEITATTKDGKILRTEKYLDGGFAHQIFLWFTEATDADEVVMIDGLTGEVLNLWRNNRFEVFCGYIVG